MWKRTSAPRLYRSAASWNLFRVPFARVSYIDAIGIIAHVRMGSTDSASRTAFLPEFSHDIFVSYAHVDNIPDRPKAKGWVDRFYDQLHTAIWKKLGETAKIWIDRTD